MLLPCLPKRCFPLGRAQHHLGIWPTFYGDPPSWSCGAGMHWAVLKLKSHGCCKLCTSSCVWGTHWCCQTACGMGFICSAFSVGPWLLCAGYLLQVAVS